MDSFNNWYSRLRGIAFFILFSKHGSHNTHSATQQLNEITEINWSGYSQLPLEPQKATLFMYAVVLSKTYKYLKGALLYVGILAKNINKLSKIINKMKK